MQLGGKNSVPERFDDANREIAWITAVHRDDTGRATSGKRTNRGGCFRPNRASRAAGVRATGLPRSWLYLDARILGLWRRRLLLGAWNMGDGAAGWLPLDARLLGLCRRRL